MVLLGTGSCLFAEDGARYLVIAHDNFYAAVQPLAQWKTRKGMLAKVVRFSEVGSSTDSIQAYVRHAYQTWPVRPQYVLIVGAPDFISSSRLRTDDGYGDVIGDHQVELPVGRFFAATPAECSTLVEKSLIYEKTPFAAGDSNWMRKGTTVINEDNPPDTYYQPDCRYIRALWNMFNFVQTDSLMDTWGDSSVDVRAAINAGRGFVVYRGQCISNWWPPFDQVNPATLSNGDKLPVVVSGSCETMTLTEGETMLADQFVRAGTAQERRGAVAYFGTTNAGASVSLKRGTVTKAFFTAVFVEGRYKIGDACIRAKFYLDSLVPGLQYFYEEWNLLGDPELPLWTERPAPLAATFDASLPLGSQDFIVHVTRNGVPLGGALVCVMMDSTVYATGQTQGQGDVTLGINAVNTGTVFVTVTARNCLPLEDSAQVVLTDLADGQSRMTGPALTCRPSPARGAVTVGYSMSERGLADVTVYDAGGCRVRSLFSGNAAAGAQRLVWDVRNDRGSTVPAGVYVIKLRAAGSVFVRKLVLFP